MAVPSYDDLLARQNVDSNLMELTFEDEHLRELASKLESCELLGIYLEIPDTDIKGIMSQGEVEVQKIRLLKCWKQRCGSAATYRAMVNALLQIKRTDLAEKVIALRQTLRDTSQSPPSSICTGSITLFMESVKPNVNNEKLAKLCKDEGVASIQVDRENLPSNDQTKVWTNAKADKTSAF